MRRLLVLAALAVVGLAVAADPPESGFGVHPYTHPDGKPGKYVAYVPPHLAGKKGVPVILFLHGSGERMGGDRRPIDVGLGPAIRAAKRFPFVVLFPRCVPEGEETGGPGWSGSNGDRAMAVLDAAMKEFDGDPKRVYLTGLSMGGSGTWGLAAKYPDRWAAIAPLCGRDHPKAVAKIKDLPCWAFHGDADDVAPVEGTRDMIAALKAAGGKPRYTEIKGAGHNVWDAAYRNPKLYDWFLEHKKPD